jgi:hypothetical protein
MHDGRALSHTEYWKLVTRGLASNIMPSFTKTPDGHDITPHMHDREGMGRARWRRLAMPWRRDKVN